MKYKITPIIVYLLLALSTNAQTKVVGECSVQFDIEQFQNQSWQPLGQKTVQVKGNQCKTTLVTPKLQQSVIFSSQEDSAVVLKEIGESKFFQKIAFPQKNLPELVTMKKMNTDSVIHIAGYPCNAVQLVFSDETIYDVLYTNAIIPTIPNFEMAFKDIPGLVLSYSITTKKGVPIRYQAINVDLSPITLNQFEFNKNEYQIID
ncbi:MAG: hypothetical protein RLZZ196_1208 [Bacteroidota bacterium]|jgi:hypothetical protein